MTLSVVLGLVLVTSPIHGQSPPRETPAAPATFDEAIRARWEGDIARWEAVARKIITMGRDFPEDKLSFRFHPDSRSFLEEIWHETFDLQLLEGRLKGTSGSLDVKKLFSGEGRPRDRDGAARDLEAVGNECATLLRKNPAPDVVAGFSFYLEHGSVAYGKLAAMYRANGLVPPASRKAGTKDSRD